MNKRSRRGVRFANTLIAAAILLLAGVLIGALTDLTVIATVCNVLGSAMATVAIMMRLAGPWRE
jgi:hypothetical protein